MQLRPMIAKAEKQQLRELPERSQNKFRRSLKCDLLCSMEGVWGRVGGGEEVKFSTNI